MAPMVVGTDRLVDPDISPAFLAVRDAREELKNAGFDRSSICIPRLQNALEDSFENQKASPLDMDHDGNTLLYVSKSIASFDLDVNNNIQIGSPLDSQQTSNPWCKLRPWVRIRHFDPISIRQRLKSKCYKHS